MLFQNLSVTRLIIHEVFRRNDDREKIEPSYGTQLISLNADAKSALHDRIIAALGSQSQCLEMAIAKTNAGSCFDLCTQVVTSDDATFVTTSRKFADLLADAQTSRQLPGGIVVVFDGTVGHPSKKIIGAIKAEPHTGFMRQITNTGMALQYLKDLILTPQTKLYKLGIFIQINPDHQQIETPPNGWMAYVYDNVMTLSNRNAAQYFYEVFLGCAFPQNSALQTKNFYDLTKGFIRNLSIPEETKIDLLTGLYTYLKVDQATTIEVATFANTFLPSPELRDRYQGYMAGQNFPLTAVAKDISELKHSFRQRRITFGGDIKLTAPPERFSDAIQIEQVHATDQPEGISPQMWTRITIRERVSSQE